jgi:hypothetical protein
MSISGLCERIQDTWWSRFISESTWGYPIAGALHVLVIALFGIAVLIPHIRVLGFTGGDFQDSDPDTAPWIRRAGLALILITGVVLFVSGAARYYQSTAFRIKMILLVLIALEAIVFRQRRSKLNSVVTLALWAAVIFVSRGIAFF